MAGKLVVNTINTDTVGAVFTTQNAVTGIAKAWANYNGSTQTIRDSFNISSITKNATGDYTVTFTTAMPNANYSVLTSSQAGSGVATTIYPFTLSTGGSFTPVNPTASSFRLTTAQSGSYADIPFALFSVFSS